MVLEKVSSLTLLWQAVRAGGRGARTLELNPPLLQLSAEMTSETGVAPVASQLICARQAGISVGLLETFLKLPTG